MKNGWGYLNADIDSLLLESLLLPSSCHPFVLWFHLQNISGLTYKKLIVNFPVYAGELINQQRCPLSLFDSVLARIEVRAKPFTHVTLSSVTFLWLPASRVYRFVHFSVPFRSWGNITVYIIKRCRGFYGAPQLCSRGHADKYLFDHFLMLFLVPSDRDH